MKPGIKKTMFQLVVFVLTIVILFIALNIWLKAYTRHDKALRVPDVTMQHLEEAALSLKNNALRFEIIDSIRNANHPAGVVLEQRPSAGSKVKENRIIYLTINSQEEKYMMVPNVKDFSQRQAIATLQALGFKIADVRFAPSEYRDLVIDVQYEGLSVSNGASLPVGTALDLIVGQGAGSEKIAIPELIGKSLDSAIIIAHESSVNIGDIYYDVEPDNKRDANKYFVYMQDPAPHMHYNVGKRVNVWMSKNPDMLLSPDSLLIEDIEIDF
ncbi:MAG: PASTA domain-containing protein [Bacteroidales bacterium]|nr:PASTA domain-containing protein [Bacteroidales bacterium]